MLEEEEAQTGDQDNKARSIGPDIRQKQNSHKGSFGHAAVFCGEKEGAGIISGMAATHFGAGLTTLVVHEKVSPPPYLMHSTVVPDNATALAIGMGLGGHFESEFLEKYVFYLRYFFSELTNYNN